MQTEKMREEAEILQLSNKMIYQRYQMNKSLIQKFFQDLSIPEYMALHMAVQLESKNPSKKTYLKELAERMHLEVRHASKIVGDLRERGLVIWSHDGKGSEGTYIILTDDGRMMLKQQEESLRVYFGKVIGRFGKEKLIQMLDLMKQMDDAIDMEMEACE